LSGYRFRDVSYFSHIEFYNISFDIDAIVNRGIKIIGDIALFQSPTTRIENITFTNLTMINANHNNNFNNTISSNSSSISTRTMINVNNVMNNKNLINNLKLSFDCSNAKNIQWETPNSILTCRWTINSPMDD
jgi:hypothetical protein